MLLSSMLRVNVLVFRMFIVVSRMVMSVVAIMIVVMSSSDSSIRHPEGCGNHRACGVRATPTTATTIWNGALITAVVVSTSTPTTAPMQLVSDSAGIRLPINFGYFIRFLWLILLLPLSDRDALQ